MKYFSRLILFCVASALMLMMSSCYSPDNGLRAVGNFEASRYMGVWYEHGRYPHRFEAGLSNVKAEYKLREDGRVSVLNSAYDDESAEWTSISGRAYFPGSPKEAELRVCFFWPFYGTYRVVWLEPDYSAAIVTSDSWDYLWILARKPDLSTEKYSELEARAVGMGFIKERIVKVSQERSISAEK